MARITPSFMSASSCNLNRTSSLMWVLSFILWPGTRSGMFVIRVLSVMGILRHSSIWKMDSAGWQKYHRCRGLGNHHGSDPLLTVHFALGLGEVPEASKSLR